MCSLGGGKISTTYSLASTFTCAAIMQYFCIFFLHTSLGFVCFWFPVVNPEDCTALFPFC